MIGRRTLLRRALIGGGAVMALPFLDSFLDESGEAVAETGRPLPIRFGTFFWGCGLVKELWVPPTVGPNYEQMPHFESLAPLKDKISVFSGFRAITDGKGNHMHHTGGAAIITGAAPSTQSTFDAESLDVTLARSLGHGTRFRSIELSPSGDPRISMSTLGGRNRNRPETTALALYTRLFGPDYQEPRSGAWSPDPKINLDRSVLSLVAEDRKALLRQVGATDRARLDQYFTSVRQTEQQLAAGLERPVVSDACTTPVRPGELRPSGAIPILHQNVEAMSQLLALAVACNQTKIFNMFLSEGASQIFQPGAPMAFHQSTHEEPDDEKLGYQLRTADLGTQSLIAFGMLLKALDSVKEGDKTLLDRSLVLAYTDTSYAKVHAVDGIPMLLAGSANGRVKTGHHIAAAGAPVTRVGLTIQQGLGMNVASWGTDGMATSKPITELLA